jgi:hypothetical protein
MKASKELIDFLESLTIDEEGFPKLNKELVYLDVGTLRFISNILKFQRKGIYKEDGENSSKEPTLPTVQIE